MMGSGGGEDTEGPVISMYNSRVGLNQGSFSVLQSCVQTARSLVSHMIPSLGPSDSWDPDVADSPKSWGRELPIGMQVHHSRRESPASACSLTKPKLPF